MPQTHLLDLPKEIRETIWSYTLARNPRFPSSPGIAPCDLPNPNKSHGITITAHRRCFSNGGCRLLCLRRGRVNAVNIERLADSIRWPRTIPGLFLTNRQTHSETLPIFYSVNEILIPYLLWMDGDVIDEWFNGVEFLYKFCDSSPEHVKRYVKKITIVFKYPPALRFLDEICQIIQDKMSTLKELCLLVDVRALEPNAGGLASLELVKLSRELHVVVEVTAIDLKNSMLAMEGGMKYEGFVEALQGAVHRALKSADWKQDDEKYCFLKYEKAAFGKD